MQIVASNAKLGRPKAVMDRSVESARGIDANLGTDRSQKSAPQPAPRSVKKMQDRQAQRREKRRQLAERYEARRRQQEAKEAKEQTMREEAEAAAESKRKADRRMAKKLEAKRKAELKARRELAAGKRALARLHYERALLRYCGFAPWKKIVEMQELRRVKADSFVRYRRMESALTSWRAAVDFITAQRQQRAKMHFDRHERAKMFFAWSALLVSKKNRQRAAMRHFRRQQARSRLRIWKSFTTRKIRERRNREKIAKRIGNIILIRRIWRRWLDGLVQLELDKKVESKTKETLKTVHGWLQEMRQVSHSVEDIHFDNWTPARDNF
jgi:hypothetical protein